MQPGQNTKTRRERMSADQRQAAILDAAAQLLTKSGWEKVTINEILAAAGISKGGFYHHFSSKDDILAALILRFTDAATAAATTGQKLPGAGVVDRLSAFLRGTLQWELDHADQVISFVRLARHPGNGPLFIGLSQETERRTLPVLRELLAEGADSGAFELGDIGMTADLFLRISRTRWLKVIDVLDAARAGRMEDARESLCRRLSAEQQAFERLLDLPPGSIDLRPTRCIESLLQ